MDYMKPFPVFLLLIVPALETGCGPGPAPPPTIAEPIEIVVTGTNYRWQVRNPGLDGALETGDDIQTVQELRVPFATDIHLELKSLDFLYTFSVPELNLREIAVPDLGFTLGAFIEGFNEILIANFAKHLGVEIKPNHILWSDSSRPSKSSFHIKVNCDH